MTVPNILINSEWNRFQSDVLVAGLDFPVSGGDHNFNKLRMVLQQAIDLMPESFAKLPQSWADLGCGHGLFSLALATRLADDSTIYAVDKQSRILAKIPDRNGNVVIKKSTFDFVNDPWPITGLDGILMANSLHFVRHKQTFLRKAISKMKSPHQFLIIEYDTDGPNQWVPFPVSFPSLASLFGEMGYPSVNKLAEQPSAYNRANIYSAIIEK